MIHHPAHIDHPLVKQEVVIPVRSRVKDLLMKVLGTDIEEGDWVVKYQNRKIDLDVSLYPSYLIDTIDIGEYIIVKILVIYKKNLFVEFTHSHTNMTKLYGNIPSASKFSDV